MTKPLVKALTLLLVLSAGVMLHADVTIGTYDTGNCYPLLCNDSGTNSGPTLEYQQVYAASQFSGTTTITDITFYYASQFGGTQNVLGGNYTFSLGISNFGVNGLSGTLGNNFKSGTEMTVGTFSFAPFSGPSCNPSCTFNISPFSYNPADGPLLLDINASNQDNVPNGSGNGYNEADDTGSVTSRAYAFLGTGTGVSDSVGLVTTFSTGVSTTPEPSSLLLTASGLLAMAGVVRRKWLK